MVAQRRSFARGRLSRSTSPPLMSLIIGDALASRSPVCLWPPRSSPQMPHHVVEHDARTGHVTRAERLLKAGLTDDLAQFPGNVFARLELLASAEHPPWKGIFILRSQQFFVTSERVKMPYSMLSGGRGLWRSLRERAGKIGNADPITFLGWSWPTGCGRFRSSS